MKNYSLTAVFALLVASVGCGNGPGIRGITPVTGNYSNASLNGSYVYHLSGTVSSSGSLYEESGVFLADGNGNITGGVDDATQGTSISLGNSISGTYSISADGTGSISLTGTAFTSTSLAVTLVSSSRAYLIEADALDASGVAQLQTTSAITAAPSGTYVFRMHTTSAQGSTATVGQVTVSGGAFQSGSVDVNRAGVASSPTLTAFTFNAPTVNGRGSGSFTETPGATSSFNYYIVDSNHIRLLSTDASSNIGGEGVAELQTGGPFSASSFSGSYVFSSAGDDATGIGSVNTVGQFTAAGGTISSGTYDSVADGTPQSNVAFTSGTYQVSANGRVTASFVSPTGTSNKVFWLVTPTRAFFLTSSDTSNSTLIEDGTADLQQTSTFSNSSINGQFALMMHGFNPNFFIDRVGTLQWDGAGNLKLNEVVNDTGTVNSPGQLTGTYSVSPNGRVTGTVTSLSVNPNDLVFYMISNTDGYALQADSATQLAGRVTQQQ
jgi:hypothetical protein